MTNFQKKLCTGCGACYSVCPNNAITIIENEKGFLKPHINKDKCTDCSACTKICPLNNVTTNNVETPEVFWALNNEDKIREKSSSGGLFYLFAQNILASNGVVFGCVWDENMQPKHIYTKELENIYKMFSSKYVQSNTENTFKEVKEFLSQGKKVLYSGTPCQIAGLKSYLRKDYDNLFLIDLICHGVPSRKTFEMFKKEWQKENNIKENIININMRSKTTDWGKPFKTVITTEYNTYEIPFDKNNFLESFLHNYNIGDACIDCKFCSLPRSGDVTIGDFCGVDEFDKSLNDKKGISILFVNSEKGKTLFDNIKEKCSWNSVPFENAIKYNQNVIKPSKPNLFRDKFFDSIIKGKTLKDSMNVARNNYPLFFKLLFKIQPQFIKNFIKRFI